MKEERTFRPVPGLSRAAEEEQLSEILSIAEANIARTEDYIRQLEEELHDLMETYGPKDKEGLSLLRNTKLQLQDNQRDWMRHKKARKKPYFGRIDFRDKNQPQDESYYVGRVGISKNVGEPVVIDWRAPIASVYYENALGPCRYLVKDEGSYEITLKRKRTYEIAEDRLRDFFDSDVVATDELLNRYLAKSKRAVLSEIIATIQKEQNALIRISPKTNLIVQGVAGSGKTTVAMHRISYILYNYEEEFRPEDFYIIGSNRVLLNYITGVLPELDVYGVAQMTMEQLFVRLCYEDWNPQVHQISPIDKKRKEACLKGSLSWFHDLEQFCQAYEDAVIPREPVCLKKSGAVLLDTARIDTYLKQNRQLSVQGKIRMLNEFLLARLENELSGKYVSYTPAEKKELERMYRCHFGRDVWKGSIFVLYEEFLLAQAENGKQIPYTRNVFDVYDLAALAYLYKRIKETDGIREASHVIIDEAQDFGMMAYGALAYCLRDCTYTIMGDVSQNIYYGYGLNDWSELQKLLLRGTYDTFGLLKKSYRNTVEISDFAAEILRHGSFPVYPVEPILRHGNAVALVECADEAAMLEKTAETIRSWQEQGHETIAVICRDSDAADAVSRKLEGKLWLADGHIETAEFGSGVMVLPVEYTKGLEFDAVVLYDPSKENYPAADAYVKLLYVAATRALHELVVIHQGDLTDLIAQPVSEAKQLQLLEQAIRPQAVRYQKQEQSVREQEISAAQYAQKEHAMRGYIGPKRIEAAKKSSALSFAEHMQKPPQAHAKTAFTPVPQMCAEREAKKVPSEEKKNLSPYRFGEIPIESALRPAGHSRIDQTVRIVKKTKTYIELTSSYGTLRLTPLARNILRVQFLKTGASPFLPGYWNYKPKELCPWTAKEGRAIVEVCTEALTVRIDKRTGALHFLEKSGQLLLAERAALPRQIDTAGTPRIWMYFDWQKKEKLYAKGVLKEEWERMQHKARYISFGGMRLRMPLLVSELGYGIGVAAEQSVLCCTIPTYGPYVSADGSGQLDYYFLYGGDTKSTLALYEKLQDARIYDGR